MSIIRLLSDFEVEGLHFANRTRTLDPFWNEVFAKMKREGHVNIEINGDPDTFRAKITDHARRRKIKVTTKSLRDNHNVSRAFQITPKAA